jgi:hypothetical protein
MQLFARATSSKRNEVSGSSAAGNLSLTAFSFFKKRSISGYCVTGNSRGKKRSVSARRMDLFCESFAQQATPPGVNFAASRSTQSRPAVRALRSKGTCHATTREVSTEKKRKCHGGEGLEKWAVGFAQVWRVVPPARKALGGSRPQSPRSGPRIPFAGHLPRSRAGVWGHRHQGVLGPWRHGPCLPPPSLPRFQTLKTSPTPTPASGHFNDQKVNNTGVAHGNISGPEVGATRGLTTQFLNWELWLGGALTKPGSRRVSPGGVSPSGLPLPAAPWSLRPYGPALRKGIPRGGHPSSSARFSHLACGELARSGSAWRPRGTRGPYGPQGPLRGTQLAALRGPSSEPLRVTPLAG